MPSVRVVESEVDALKAGAAVTTLFKQA